MHDTVHVEGIKINALIHKILPLLPLHPTSRDYWHTRVVTPNEVADRSERCFAPPTMTRLRDGVERRRNIRNADGVDTHLRLARAVVGWVHAVAPTIPDH